MKYILSFTLLIFIFLSHKALKACDNQLEISSVTFITDVSLSHKDLSRNLPARRGALCTPDVVNKSIEILKERNIFEIIEVSEYVVDDKVQLTFQLIPYLILSKVRFSGNTVLRSLDLRRVIGVRGGEIILDSHIQQIQDRVLKAYNEAGYFNTKVEINLIAESTAPLTRVEVRIREGRPRKISELKIIEGDEELLSKILSEIKDYAVGKTMTREALREIRDYSIKSFRRRGFHQARISVLADSLDNDSQIIKLYVSPRNRIRFDIQGNRFFSNQEILEPLRLEQRKVPLNSTALDSICREVLNIYKEAGYIRVNAECVKNTEEDKRYGGIREVFSIKIDEGNYYRVRSVVFRGNKSISNRELSNLVNVVPKSFIGILFGSQRGPTDEILQNDISRIKDAYQRIGLNSVNVRTSLKINDDERSIEVRYRIKEDGSNEISKISFVIDYPEDKDNAVYNQVKKWENSFPLKTFDSIKFETEIDKLRSEIFALGYPEPQISWRFSDGDKVLLVSINLGPKITVGRIILEGNFYTHDRIILREILLKKGDLWNPLKIDESKQALFSLGIFRSVIIKPSGEVFKGPVQDMKVRVFERETGTVQGSLELSTQDGLRVQMQAGQRNLFGDARALVLALDGYFRGNDTPVEAARARVAYGSPRFLGTSLDYGFELYYQTTLQQNDSFKLDRYGFRNSLRYPLLNKYRFNLSHSAYSERLFDVESNMILAQRDTGSTFYSVFNANIEIDKRDDPFNPSNGYRFELGAGYFPNWAGSEVRMAELSAQETSYFPISSKFTYVFNLRGALRETLNSNEIVPLGSRYFIGGRDTLRGHTRFQVGARALEDGLVVGGDTFAVFSQELRYLLTDSVVGLVFVDIGQAFLRNEVGDEIDAKNNLKDMRISPGFGFQYITPIGPLSAELGFATDREFGERFGRFLVSIGSAF